MIRLQLRAQNSLEDPKKIKNYNYKTDAIKVRNLQTNNENILKNQAITNSNSQL